MAAHLARVAEPNFVEVDARARAPRELIYGHHEDRSPTHGYEPTREAAMAAFAKFWRRESLAPSRQPTAFSRPRAHELLTVPVDHAAHPS